jgi:hypothetical protein
MENSIPVSLLLKQDPISAERASVRRARRNEDAPEYFDWGQRFEETIQCP